MKYCYICNLCEDKHEFPIIYNKDELRHVIYAHLVSFHLNEINIKEVHKYPWKYVSTKTLK